MSVKNGDIQTADKLFKQIIDRICPLELVYDIFSELDEFRDKFSNESASLLDEIESKLLKSMDALFTVSQLVYEFTTGAEPLLEAFIPLYSDYKPNVKNTQKDLLYKHLDSGENKLTWAQNSFTNRSNNLNLRAGTLRNLQHRLSTEFDGKSALFQSKIIEIRSRASMSEVIYGIFGKIAANGVELLRVPQLQAKMISIEKYYAKINEQISQILRKIDDVKGKFSTETQQIGEVKVHNELTMAYMNIVLEPKSYDLIVKSAKHLIAKCQAYRHKHKQSNACRL